MPEITVIHIGLMTLAVFVGVIAGWAVRGNRCAQEKVALNTLWQEQREAQRTENDRLLGQNKSLMEQVNQNQASGKDATNRAKELSGALKEAFARRDELQREIKDVRNMLESAVDERDKLQAGNNSGSANDDSLEAALKRKDDKISKLSRDLENWQGRLPPLIERYRVRNMEAEQLEVDLEEARERIRQLESTFDPEETRVDPIDSGTLSDGMEASNDPVDDDEELVAAEEILEETDADDETQVEEVDSDDETHIEEIDSDDATHIEEVDSGDETHVEEHSFDGESFKDIPHNDIDTSNLRDDLKQIKGVGPAIEKTLHELGIFRFGQIAQMSEYDIDRVAKRLKGFRTRIYREDWIGQARDLQDQQASEQA
jgi:predicted flap endonuclease-1-like 5' DNA nuclease